MESRVLVLIVALCLPHFQCAPKGEQHIAGWFDSAEEMRCYPPLGCLELTKEWYSLERPFNPFPISREAVGTHFKLYTRENYEGETLEVDETKDVDTKYFKPERGTKFVIHGFLEKGSKDWLMEIMEALLQRMDVNVILVNWQRGAVPLYKDATSNTRLVGLEIAYLVNALIEKKGLSAKDVHLIGHSLGAHVAGYAGEKIKNLGRITGLDPAGPNFRNMPTFVRLDPSDAIFVDAIRTDSHYGFGSTPQQLGHLDFYPNGGESQPFCSLREKRSLGFPVCSHHRSVLYFLESILSSPYFEGGEDKCPFVAFGCKSYEELLRGRCLSCGQDGLNCALMGLDADKYPGLSPGMKEKNFFLKTNTAAPYCGYHYRVNLTVANAGVGNRVAGNLTVFAIGERGRKTALSLEREPRTFSTGETYTLLGFSPEPTGKVVAAHVELEANPNSVVNRRSRSFESTKNFFADATVAGFVYPPPKFKTSRTCKPSDFKAVGNDRYNFEFNC